MSTTTPTANPRAGGARLPVTPARVVRSEWIKFATLRSSWYTLGAAVASLIAIGGTVAYLTGTSTWSTLAHEDTAASATLQGWKLAELFIGVLGVLFVTGEYGTGMIRSTFTAVPRRLPVVAAKSAVFGLVALVTMTISSFATYFLGQTILSSYHHSSSISAPGALRSVIGVGVLLTLVALLGVSLGWIIRSTAGAISALVGFLLIVPLIIGFLPGRASAEAGKFLPDSAGGSFVTSYHQTGTLQPWIGLGVTALWVVAALTAAAVTVHRRDA